jgi:hypothetical protein
MVNNHDGGASNFVEARGTCGISAEARRLSKIAQNPKYIFLMTARAQI